LLHFNLIMSFGLDGFAHAAEALTGRAYGARNARALRAVVLSALSWAAVAALAFCLFYVVTGRVLINWMTVLPAVRWQAYTFLPWLVVAPLVAVWAYLLDGVYLGTTHTAEMRNGMLLALSGYVVCVWVTQPLLHNHGLWLSFILFLLGRALPLAFWYRRIERAADGASPAPRSA
jgi:MATE family multidrug resistance protein